MNLEEIGRKGEQNFFPTQDWVQWLALVSTMINRFVLQKAGCFLPT
jgi:hypothetical protein